MFYYLEDLHANKTWPCTYLILAFCFNLILCIDWTVCRPRVRFVPPMQRQDPNKDSQSQSQSQSLSQTDSFFPDPFNYQYNAPPVSGPETRVERISNILPHSDHGDAFPPPIHLPGIIAIIYDLGGISSSVLSVFFTDNCYKLLKSLHLIGWEQICQCN